LKRAQGKKQQTGSDCWPNKIGKKETRREALIE
jgi:hypothetical protein